MKTRHYSAITTRNLKTGHVRYFIDGVRVSENKARYMLVVADRISCIQWTKNKTVERVHKLLSVGPSA